MKDNNNNPNPSLEIFRGHQLTVQETVGSIQNISKNIRDYSLKMRDTMKTLRESGAIPEMAEAIRDGSANSFRPDLRPFPSFVPLSP